MKKITIEIAQHGERWVAAASKDLSSGRYFGNSTSEAVGELILSHALYFESFGIYFCQKNERLRE